MIFQNILEHFGVADDSSSDIGRVSPVYLILILVDFTCSSFIVM